MSGLWFTYTRTSKNARAARQTQYFWQVRDQLVLLSACFLRRSSDSALLGECLQELAKKYPQTKFLKIISTECIPNYPDKNLPTVLIYKDTKCVEHLIGLAQFGGRRVTPERMCTAA